MIGNNCFWKALAQNLFMQGSTLSLYFPYLLSDTVLQFPALDASLRILRIWQWFRLYQIELADSLPWYFIGETRGICAGNKTSGSHSSYIRMTSDYFRLRDRLSRNNRRNGRNNTRSVDARARRPKWFSDSILRRNTDPQVGVKRWKTWRQSVNISLECFR